MAILIKKEVFYVYSKKPLGYVRGNRFYTRVVS